MGGSNLKILTLADRACHEAEIKRSRFIAVALPVESPPEAMGAIEKVSLADATHNCWAYKIGGEYRFSDDGEPGGSAGRPILAAIEGQGLDHVAVVVSRYFGGRKLGVGGLVRAYGGTAAECLRLARRLEIKPRSAMSVEIPFPDISNVYHILPDYDVVKKDESYTETGVVMELELETECLQDFRKQLSDITRGAAKLIKVGEI